MHSLSLLDSIVKKWRPVLSFLMAKATALQFNQSIPFRKYFLDVLKMYLPVCDNLHYPNALCLLVDKRRLEGTFRSTFLIDITTVIFFK